MAAVAHSCARATMFRQGDSSSSAWDWISGQFRKDNTSSPKSFIECGYSIDPVDDFTGDPQAGYVYKYLTAHRSEMYVKLLRWNPLDELAYAVDWMPTTGKYLGHSSTKTPPTTMRFFLEDHPEGTIVTIERAERACFPVWKKILDVAFGGWGPNTCVSRLAGILTGTMPENQPRSFSRGNLTIRRDDSLKNLLLD